MKFYPTATSCTSNAVSCTFLIPKRLIQNVKLHFGKAFSECKYLLSGKTFQYLILHFKLGTESNMKCAESNYLFIDRNCVYLVFLGQNYIFVRPKKIIATCKRPLQVCPSIVTPTKSKPKWAGSLGWNGHWRGWNKKKKNNTRKEEMTVCTL